MLFVVAILTIILVYLLHFIASAIFRGAKPPFISPARLPVVGHSWTYPYSYLTEILLKKEKPPLPIFSVQYWSEEWVFVGDYTLLKEILVTNGNNFSDRPNIAPFQFLHCGDAKGLTESNGVEWREQRKFSVAALRNLGLSKSGIEEKVKLQMQWFQEHLDSQIDASDDGLLILDPERSLKSLVASIISSILMGKTFGMQDDYLIRYQDALERSLMKIFDPIQGLPFRFPSLQSLPGNLLRGNELQTDLAVIASFFTSALNDRKEELNLDEMPLDFMTSYLHELNRREKTGETGTFSENQLMACTEHLWIGGYDTSSQTLCWAILYLLTHENIQETLYEELKTVTDDFRQEIGLEDRERTPYTMAFISELFRISSVADTTMFHACRQEMTVEGYQLTPGMVIVPWPHGVHMSSDVFGEPKTFKPERFLEDSGEHSKKIEHLLPFGIGKRSCPGENLARSEIYLVLALLVSNFKFTVVGEMSVPSLEPTRGFLLCPESYECKVEKRQR